MAAKKPEKHSATKADTAKAKKAAAATKGRTEAATPADKPRSAKKVDAKPEGTGAKAVPPVRHERDSQTLGTTAPEPRESAPARKRPTKATKDIYSPATGTATSEPFSEKELDKFRTMIQDLRMESIEELEALTEQLREMTASEVGEDNSAYSLHMAEQGTDAMEREKTFLQAQRTSDYVKKLAEALDRIDHGSFGLCRVCGLRLDSKRLMAVPVTQVCTVYKTTQKPCEPGRLHMQETGVTEEDIPR